MIVEDEQGALNRYKQYLQQYQGGFTVVAFAMNYQEALDQFIKTQPDLIFTDVVIPGGSGLQFIEKIRSLGYTGLVVVVSGYDNFLYAQKAVKLGAFDYLLKPIFRKDYFAMLDKVKSTISGSSIVKNDFYSEKFPSYIQKAMKIVERNYESDITLDKVAEEAGVSSAYLSMSFSKYVHMTFINFVRYYRVKVSCLLLQDMNLTLSDVAEKVGFCDASYLTRCFKKIKGITPGKYRCNFRENQQKAQ